MVDIGNFTQFSGEESTIQTSMDLATDSPSDARLTAILTQLSTVLHLYVNPVVGLLGLAGNLLSLCPLAQYVSKSSTFNYLCVLSGLDCLFLLNAVLYWLLLTGFDIDLALVVDCNLVQFLTYGNSQYAAWILVAIAVERVRIVLQPQKVKTILDVRQARVILGVIFGLVLLVNWNLLGALTSTQRPEGRLHDGHCQGRTPGITWYHQAVYPWIDSCVYSFLPAAALLLLYGTVAWQLLKSQNRVNPTTNLASARQAKRSRKLTAVAATLALLFLLLTSPIAVTSVILRMLAEDAPLRRFVEVALVGHVFNTLSLINHSVSVIVYVVFSRKFRSALRDILGKACKCCLPRPSQQQ